MAEIISAKDLIPMDLFCGVEPIEIDVVYARKDHPENIFGINAYHADARMVLHKDLAAIVVLAARLLKDRHGWMLTLKDGLRPIEAQQRLIDTSIVRKNPGWLEDPGRLLSSPGQGAHPRGMAVDVSVEGVDMGTVFDAMVPESARAYAGFAPSIHKHRIQLENAFTDAGAQTGRAIYPLASEWWDFRFPAKTVQKYAALSDADLPAPLKMCEAPKADHDWEDHFTRLAKSITESL